MSTVSRALSRPDVVNPVVRERVLAVAMEIGYRPNKLARGLATGRVGRIGLLVPDVANPFFTELLRAIHHVASTVSRRSLLIVNSDERPAAEADLLAGLLDEVDGVILASPRAQTAVLKEALADVPTVIINRPVVGRDSVLIGYRQAVMAAGNHLLLTGHRRIAMLRGPAASWAAAQRASALKAWAAQESVELVDLGLGAPTFEAGLESVGGILDCDATAVVAYDDIVASGVVAGLHGVGLSVPKDVAVVGCDDTLLARVMTPAMTTIALPYIEIAVSAIDLLIKRIDDPGLPTRRLRLQGSLVIRESTEGWSEESSRHGRAR